MWSWAAWVAQLLIDGGIEQRENEMDSNEIEQTTDERGAGLAEYGLLLLLILVTCIAALNGLAGALTGALGTAAGMFN